MTHTTAPGVTCVTDQRVGSGNEDRPGIDLAEWYPRIQGIVPTPRTAIIRLDQATSEGLLAQAYGEVTGDDWVMRVAEAIMSEPAHHGFTRGTRDHEYFLRTGMTSVKHGWDETCRIKTGMTSVDVARHVARITEESEWEDFVGLPVDTWVIRAMEQVDPLFFAFYGRMPIVREFRYWIEDGRVLGWQPYWPPEAIEDNDPSEVDWAPRLLSASHLGSIDENTLMRLTQQVALRMPGAWSVDWLWTRRGWVLTDMAHAERSYVYDVPTLGDARKWLGMTEDPSAAFGYTEFDRAEVAAWDGTLPALPEYTVEGDTLTVAVTDTGLVPIIDPPPDHPVDIAVLGPDGDPS